jgi:protein phosphatase
MNVTSSGGTDPGKKRHNNEDAFLLQDEVGLYAVADGVGGHEGGEVASRIAVEVLGEAVPDLLGEGDRTPPAGRSRKSDPELSALRSAITLSNRKIRQAIDLDPALSGMATTLTALLLKKGRAILAHIGDSRAYLLRSGKFRQLTEDHSVVAEQLRAGVLTPEQARRSRNRNVITRALGIGDDLAVDVAAHPVQKNDTFLLCTDGLTEMVDDREIHRILAMSSPRDAVRKLLDAANDRGGVDNITAVVVRIMEV